MFANLKSFVTCWLVLFSVLYLHNPTIAQDPEPVDFVKQIQPIFEAHCVRCHGEVDPENMRMDLREEVMDYLEAEDAENSQLYELISTDDEDSRMPPPDENDPLSDEEIQLVARWINEGANWPDDLQLTDRYEEQQNGEQTNDTNQSNTGNDETSDDPEATGQTSQNQNNGSRRQFVPGDMPAPQKNEDENVVYWAIGSLHPAAVHLPIGLLMAAGLFGLLGIRGNFVMSDCAYYCLWLGTLGCIAACVSGWWFSPMEKVGTVKEIQDLWNQDHKVFWHRTSGLIITIVSLLLALYAAGARNRDPDDGVLWKLGLVLLAAGVGWTGHKGGELTHGKHHYKHLKQLLNSVFPMDEEGDPQVENANGKMGDAAKEADATGVPLDEQEQRMDLNNDGKSDVGLGRA